MARFRSSRWSERSFSSFPDALAGEDLGRVFGIDLDLGAVGDGTEAGKEGRADGLASPPPAAATPGISRRSRPHAPQPEPNPKPQPKRATARELVDDEGFGEVFGPGLEVTSQLLLGFGVPRSTFGNWVTAGVLVPGRKRGTCWTTKKTLARFLRVWARGMTAVEGDTGTFVRTCAVGEVRRSP